MEDKFKDLEQKVERIDKKVVSVQRSLDNLDSDRELLIDIHAELGEIKNYFKSQVKHDQDVAKQLKEEINSGVDEVKEMVETSTDTLLSSRGSGKGNKKSWWRRLIKK